MVSEYVRQSELAVQQNKLFTNRRVEIVLDTLWHKVDQMEWEIASGTYDDGYSQALKDVLDVIEAAGGMYVGKRKMERDNNA